jgi:pre-mRNA cleavage complex 2 protein Pcf11
MGGGNDHADDGGGMDVEQQQPADASNKDDKAPPPPVAAAVTSGDDDNDDDDDAVDEEQIEEYQEMLDGLGAHPDKLKINSLSMVAEDFAASARMAAALYGTIRTPLLSASVPRENKLPLVYVVDSLLKNVKGNFTGLIESDAKNWMPVVYEQMPSDEHRAKLRRVWESWKTFQLFSDQSWEDMGVCFVEADGEAESRRAETEAAARAVLGDVGPELRRQMQRLLDEAQAAEGVSELDKVSLDRLAEMNPGLLAEIKAAAQDIVASGGGGDGGGGAGSADGGANGGRFSPTVSSANFNETRPDEIVARAADWDRLSLDHLEKAHESISSLQQHVRAGCTSQRQYASEEDFRKHMGLLVSASAGARLLTGMLEALKVQEESKGSDGGGKVGGKFTSGAIDKSEFTRDGLKKKNPAVIARLYDGGLPFVCASDGRRFATQQELTKHMDVLFKQG